jgi:general secretion pathway protein E
LRACISQRLVRRLCEHCRQQYALSPEQVAELEATFGVSSAAARRQIHDLERHAILEGVGNSKTSGSTPSHITHLWRSSDDGCKNCHYSGYYDQTAICEVLEVSDDIRSAVLAHENAPKIHNLALKQGMVPLGLDGLVKALRGITTIEEVLRVI